MTSGLSFDHNTGPRYLILCMPKFTVLNLDIEKSTFLRAYHEVFILRNPSIITSLINCCFQVSRGFKATQNIIYSVALSNGFGLRAFEARCVTNDRCL